MTRVTIYTIIFDSSSLDWEGTSVFATECYEFSQFQARNLAGSLHRRFWYMHKDNQFMPHSVSNQICMKGKSNRKEEQKSPWWRAEDLLQHTLSEMNIKWQQPPANSWKFKNAAHRK